MPNNNLNHACPRLKYVLHSAPNVPPCSPHFPLSFLRLIISTYTLAKVNFALRRTKKGLSPHYFFPFRPFVVVALVSLFCLSLLGGHLSLRTIVYTPLPPATTPLSLGWRVREPFTLFR